MLNTEDMGIPFARLSFPYWRPRWVILYTYFRLKALLGSDQPVSRDCLLLLGTWSYLRICRGVYGFWNLGQTQRSSVIYNILWYARLLRWHMEITSNLNTLKLPSYSVAVLNWLNQTIFPKHGKVVIYDLQYTTTYRGMYGHVSITWYWYLYTLLKNKQKIGLRNGIINL
jgi:hypothetical protein